MDQAGSSAEGAPRSASDSLAQEDTTEITKEIFASQVQSTFAMLTEKGYHKGDAAALAFRCAAGVAPTPASATDLIELVADFCRSGEREPLLTAIQTIFGDPNVFSTSFHPPRPVGPAEAEGESSSGQPSPSDAALLQIDFPGIRKVYQEIRALADTGLTAALQAATTSLVGALEHLQKEEPAAGPSILRQVLMLFESPMLEEDTEPGSLLNRLCLLVATMSAALRTSFVRCLQAHDKDRFMRLIEVVQQLISVHMMETENKIDAVVESGTFVLGCLYDANEGLRTPLVPFTSFYIEAINVEDFDIREDYRRWKQSGGSEFSFCTFPFVYDPAAKARLLQLETSNKMMREFENAVMRSIFDQSCPYCVIRVRRGSRLISDTLREVSRQQNDLRKPLKVQFVGEDGVDEGGVQKEFFQLVVRDIFNPNFGMFTYDERERFFWFASHGLDFVGVEEYELVGTILGLALYNGHILDLRFPLFVYSKLTAHVPKFSDLKGVNPDLHRGLQQLLDFEGDVETVFGLSFQVSQESMGCQRTIDLVDGGADRPVTSENRQQYVDLYTQWYLHGSIADQFAAFEKGFRRLCKGPTLALFRAEELEQLLCGNPVLDFEALERGATYDDGFTAASSTVRWFWQVAHSLTEEEKKRLLFFATGSDRVPIKGLHTLPFVLSRNGTGDDRLPSAHTCFNHLLVPEYSSEKVLREKLLMAIANAEGFGLM